MHIILNMIVKDEAHVIERCLKSVLPIIDAWCIVDTGSSDGTPERIEQILRGVPGELHHRDWVDFGHNRTEALRLAQEYASANDLFGSAYLLFIDADDELHIGPDFLKPSPGVPAYRLEIFSDPISYTRDCLVKADISWRYEGVLHESLVAPLSDNPQLFDSTPLPDLKIIRHFDGARSQLSDEEKYSADAKVLEQALNEDPDNLRYLFYLAQSYRDGGQIEKAREVYLCRAQSGGWEEEAWYADFQATKLGESIEAIKPDRITTEYLKVIERRPSRIEPWVALASHARRHDLRTLALMSSTIAKDMVREECHDRLFVDQSCYDWKALDEYSIATYWCGNYSESAIACCMLLSQQKLPHNQVKRVAENLRWAQEALQKEGSHGVLQT